MNAPLTTLFSLALALAAASPAWAIPIPMPKPDITSPSSPQSVPDNFVGPLAPGQCYASQCPGSMGPTEDALQGIGGQQMADSVKKDEDGMLKSGVYSAIDRDPAGNGAVITMPDGSIMYSDYRRGFDSIPKKPEELLNDPKFLADNPTARAALLAAAQKAQQKQKDQDQICSSLNAGSECAGKKSDKGTPGPGVMNATDLGGDKSAATPPPADPAAAPAAADASDPDWQSMGGVLNGGGPAVASNNGDTGARDFQRTVTQDNANFNDQLANKAADGTLGKLDSGAQGFISTRKAAARMNKAITEGTRVLQSETDQSAAPVPAAPQRGSNFFGR